MKADQLVVSVQYVAPAVLGTIGAEAIDRAHSVNNAVFRLTLIEGSNPASVDGTVRKIYLFIKNGNTTDDITVGAFYKTNSNTFSTRAGWGILKPNPAQGLNEYTQWHYQGLPGLSDIEMAVQIGDYIGVRLDAVASAVSGLALDYDAGWTNDYWRTLEETNFPYTDYEFNNLGKRIISLEGDIEA